MTSEVELVHPLYLDVPMMTSFYAALEGGIAFETDVTRKQDRQKNASGEGEGQFRLPNFLATIGIGLDMKGQIKETNVNSKSDETKLVLKHTEASLFIQLRHQLIEHKAVTQIKSENDLKTVHHSSLIETTGTIFRNPLYDAMRGLEQLGDLFGVDLFPKLKPTDNKKKDIQPISSVLAKINSGNLESSQELAFRALAKMHETLENSEMTDAILKSIGIDQLTIILNMNSTFLRESTFENFLSGHFTVLGKVVRILEEHETLNLFQRTIMGLIDEETANKALLEAIHYFSRVKKLDIIIKYPAIQIIPLAIFV